MSAPEPGRIVLASTEAGLRAGVVVESRGGRTTVITAEGARETWLDERIFHVSGARAAVHPVQTAAAALKAFVSGVQNAADGADIAEAWEILVDEKKSGPLAEIADLLCGGDGAVELAAASWAIEKDAIHFKRQKEGFYSVSGRQAVESMRRARQHEQQENDRLTRVAGMLGAALDTNSVADLSNPLVAAGVGWLGSVVYEGLDGRDSKRGIRLLEAIRGTVPSEPDFAAFECLVRLGAADPDEIVSIKRNHIPTKFSPEVEADAAALAASVRNAPGAVRLEWNPGRGPIAIDDETTRDVDDALMVEPADGATLVHILVADPSSTISLDSPTGKAGMARASSLYAPTGTIPMLPPVLSEGALSLSADGDRPMLDFAVTLGDDGTVVDFAIRPVFGRLETRLTYDQVDQLFETGSGGAEPFERSLAELDRLARALKARRVSEGAVLLERDEYSVKVVDGIPKVRRILPTSASRTLVAEFMILAGAVAGRFARQNDIPVVFRRQDPPDGPDGALEEKTKGLPEGSKARSYAMLRCMKRGELSTIPGFHHSLGVAGYTQVTSPLRRFQDFLAHVQIKGFLADGRAPTGRDELVAMFAELEGRTEIVTKVERESRRYWTLKYLKSCEGRVVEGEVVGSAGNRALVELDETGLILPVAGAVKALPGSRIRLTVREVDPRRDRVTLNPA